MAILLLILLLLFGLRGGDVVSEPGVAEPVERPTLEVEPPPLPPDVVVVEEGTPAAEAGSPALPTEAGEVWDTPGVFTDVAYVEAHLTDPAVEIVALTPGADFVAGHVPGAVQIDWKPFEIVETGDQQVASWRAEVEGILTRLSISPTDTVVVYDGGTLYASRLWWVLDQLGHEDKLILDGGLSSWEEAGLPLEAGATIPEPAVDGGPYVGTPDEGAIATIDEVAAALGDPGVVLVDARTPEEFAEGHLPGAVNIPFTGNAVPGSGGRWRSREELRAMYAAAGVSPDMTVIPYCTTGVRSAATYVTLIALGYPDVSLFTGSWAEWSADPSRPVEV